MAVGWRRRQRLNEGRLVGGQEEFLARPGMTWWRVNGSHEGRTVLSASQVK